MDCRTVLDNASVYIDGELEPAEAGGFAEHIRSCGACAEDLRTLREATTAATANLSELELRPEVWNRVRERIAEVPVGRPGLIGLLLGSRLRIAVSGALVLVALSSVTWIALRQRQARLEVEAYMHEYIQERRASQVGSRTTPISVPRIDETRNPFVDVDYSGMIVNPFLSEGK